MADIRILVANHPDAVFTRDGHRVEIVSTSAGWQRSLIYGYVLKDGKKVGHYWQSDGSFGHKYFSPVSLVVKTDNEPNTNRL